MAADGDIDPKELAWWKALSAATSLPEMNIQEALGIMSKYLPIDQIIKKPSIFKRLWRALKG